MDAELIYVTKKKCVCLAMCLMTRPMRAISYCLRVTNNDDVKFVLLNMIKTKAYPLLIFHMLKSGGGLTFRLSPPDKDYKANKYSKS